MNTAENVYKQALDYAFKKIEKNMVDLKDFFPFVTVKGRWEICKDEDGILRFLMMDTGVIVSGLACSG